MSKSIKVAITGQKMVGKTSLSMYLAGKKPNKEYTHTIGADYVSNYLPEYDVKLHIWDLGGEERFDTISRGYMQTPGVILFVYDATSLASVERMRVIYNDAKNCCDLDRKVLIVVGNKHDLLTNDEVNATACMFAASIDATVVMTSTKTALNIGKLIRVIMTSSGIQRRPPHLSPEQCKPSECILL
jgi:small GTP-binding protein